MKDLGEKQLQYEIKRGPSKSPPNSFQIKKIGGKDLNIWTDRRITAGTQCPRQSSVLFYYHMNGTYLPFKKYHILFGNLNVSNV